MSRLLAGRGARVTGVEPAEVLYRYAAAREREHPRGIRYLQAAIHVPNFVIVTAGLVTDELGLPVRRSWAGPGTWLA